VVVKTYLPTILQKKIDMEKIIIEQYSSALLI